MWDTANYLWNTSIPLEDHKTRRRLTMVTRHGPIPSVEPIPELEIGRAADAATRRVMNRVALGAEGVIPGRYIVSLLRVFKQFTHSLPSR